MRTPFTRCVGKHPKIGICCGHGAAGTWTLLTVSYVRRKMIIIMQLTVCLISMGETQDDGNRSNLSKSKQTGSTRRPSVRGSVALLSNGIASY